MAKRLKLRICRVIATTLQSCRSKDPSILPEDPVRPFSRLMNPNKQTTPDDTIMSIQEFKWQKEEKWHVVTTTTSYEKPPPRRKICSPHSLPPAPPPSAAEEKKRCRKTKMKKKKMRHNVAGRLRVSTSSADSGWFSSDGGEETETLVSSPLSLISTADSFSESIRGRNKRRVSKRPSAAAVEAEIPARLSVFKKMIPACAVEGKVKESFAVVKRSEDPYEDFKSSMMDMIVEKQMFEREDLEQLLQCFLSLNSRDYHGIIVGAFAEIWEEIFSPAPDCNPSDRN